VERYICIHAHFYQPPRENPWLEEIEIQDSAYPYHDWNERVTARCYAPNIAARILDNQDRIVSIVNNYADISFDVGPTLFAWLEKQVPDIYHSIIDADKLSREKFSGHGNAIAHVYNHLVMPLANKRDKQTQIVWGIQDFVHRFQRFPEGMWLAETAVDIETLELLADSGITFTILAPNQACSVRKIDDGDWSDVSGSMIDTRIPYLCRLPSGKWIHIFFYNGRIAQEVAFGGLLDNGETLAKTLLSTLSEQPGYPQLAHIATDGETYGHYHRYGEMALAYCYYYIKNNNLATITNYGEFLEKCPPVREVRIYENSSWSCVHGVNRWKEDCGCGSGSNPDWHQKWRATFRGAMDWLRDTLATIYEEELGRYTANPWKLRDDYISVILDRDPGSIEIWLSNISVHSPSQEIKTKILSLLEMQRYALAMYTSCGWSMDEISSAESVQVMLYGARAMQLSREVLGVNLESAYAKILMLAPSNVLLYGNGEKIYELLVKPEIIDLMRVGVHYALSSMFEDYHELAKIYCYNVRRYRFEKYLSGRQKLVIGEVLITSNIVLVSKVMYFAVLHIGDQSLVGSVLETREKDDFDTICHEVFMAFNSSDIVGVLNLMDKYFGNHEYSLWHVFKEEQRVILNSIVRHTVTEVEYYFKQMYETYFPVINELSETHVTLPQVFSSIIEFSLNTELRDGLMAEVVNIEDIKSMIARFGKWNAHIDTAMQVSIVSNKLNSLMKSFARAPEDVAALEVLKDNFKVLEIVPFEVNLWPAQHLYYTLSNKYFDIMKERAAYADSYSSRWLEHFISIGNILKERGL